jgi:hypothetical protein
MKPATTIAASGPDRQSARAGRAPNHGKRRPDVAACHRCVGHEHFAAESLGFARLMLMTASSRRW